MDGDWQVVRRRRGKQQQLPGDVVTQPEAQTATAAKKKKKKKKGGASSQVDASPPTPQDPAPSPSTAKAPPSPSPSRPSQPTPAKPRPKSAAASTADATSPSTPVPTLHTALASTTSSNSLSWWAWLLSLLYALLPFLRPKSPSSTLHPPEPPPVAKKPTIPSDPATKAAAPLVSSKGADAGNGTAAGMASSTAASTGAGTAAKSASTHPPSSPQTPATPATRTRAGQESGLENEKKSGSVTTGPGSQIPDRAAKAGPGVGSGGGQPGSAVAAAPKSTLAAKVEPKDSWRKGGFWIQEMPEAFGDVVGAVAMSGDLVVAAGYDSSIQLLKWTSPTAPASPPSLQKCRQLRGHRERVQAVAIDAESGLVVTGGRDSLLKVWKLGEGEAGLTAKESSSTYLYDAICCVAVEWSSGEALLGCRSNAAILWSLEGESKMQTLKGHSDEVTAVAAAPSPHCYFTGSRDCTVRLWDVRSGCKGGAIGTLQGLSGRVCSLAPTETILYVGDQSSALKAFDLRFMACGQDQEARRLGNAPLVEGEACPIAGLVVDVENSVLLSSAAAWWDMDLQGSEAADDDADLPVGCINMFSLGGKTESYIHTLRLGSASLVSCMAVSGGRVLVGDIAGGLVALSPAPKASGAGGSHGDSSSNGIVRCFHVGVGELSDSEEDESEESSDDE